MVYFTSKPKAYHLHIYSVSISEELVESAGKKAAVELGKVLAGGVAFVIYRALVTWLRAYARFYSIIEAVSQ